MENKEKKLTEQEAEEIRRDARELCEGFTDLSKAGRDMVVAMMNSFSAGYRQGKAEAEEKKVG